MANRRFAVVVVVSTLLACGPDGAVPPAAPPDPISASEDLAALLARAEPQERAVIRKLIDRQSRNPRVADVLTERAGVSAIVEFKDPESARLYRELRALRAKRSRAEIAASKSRSTRQRIAVTIAAVPRLDGGAQALLVRPAAVVVDGELVPTPDVIVLPEGALNSTTFNAAISAAREARARLTVAGPTHVAIALNWRTGERRWSNADEHHAREDVERLTSSEYRTVRGVGRARAITVFVIVRRT
jgi:hypothetical protein